MTWVCPLRFFTGNYDIFTPPFSKRNLHFWEMKVKSVYRHIKQAKEKGKKFVVFFDAYDVIFIAHRDRILDRLNAVYREKVIFCADYARSLYPYTNTDGWYDHDELKSTWLIDYIQNGDIDTSKLLNAGVYAGEIEKVIQLIDLTGLTRSDFIHRKMTFPLAERLYSDISKKKVILDDQLSFWLTMLQYPQRFHVDSDKEFVTVAATSMMHSRDFEEYRKTTLFRPKKDGTYIGNSVILHSAGGGQRDMGLIYRYDFYEPLPVSKQIANTT